MNEVGEATVEEEVMTEDELTVVLEVATEDELGTELELVKTVDVLLIAALVVL